VHEVTAEPAEEHPRPPRRWILWATAGTALLLVLGLATWWLFWSARLVVPGEDPGAFGIAVPSTSDTPQWTFGESVVCLQGVDSALVESVEVEAGDALVTAFAARSVRGRDADGTVWLFGDRPGRLADSDFGSGDRTVHGRCEDAASTEVAVELTRPSEQTARADGLLIHWSAGIRSGALHVPGHFVLCAEPDTSSGNCDPIP
jgi:hypothetical protein